MTAQPPVAVGTAMEVRPDETITHFTKHVFDKQPYPTQSRPIPFYQDHEFYLEMGEELPRHKDPPTAGGDCPLLLSGGHARVEVTKGPEDRSWSSRTVTSENQEGP